MDGKGHRASAARAGGSAALQGWELSCWAAQQSWAVRNPLTRRLVRPCPNNPILSPAGSRPAGLGVRRVSRVLERR